MPLRAIGLALATLLIAGAFAAGIGVAIQTINTQARSIDALRSRVNTLQAGVDGLPDWPAIAKKVEPSVFTVETSYGLGSGWVARSSAAGSELVTNFHVVDEAQIAGQCSST
jgi:S1-C subfamily serine protease